MLKQTQGRFSGYDTLNPFVDDYELHLYNPPYHTRLKQGAYFVCSGQVKTIEDGSRHSAGLSTSRIGVLEHL